MGLRDDIWRVFFHRSRVDDQRSVRRRGRDEHEVVIGSQRFWINTELLTGTTDFVIYPASIREVSGGQSPTAGGSVAPDVAANVLRTIEGYFEQNRYRYQVDSD